jgi:hypothetical protein
MVLLEHALDLEASAFGLEPLAAFDLRLRGELGDHGYAVALKES